MQVSYPIIGIVVIFAIALVVYLIRQNRKDEKEVTEFFDRETSNFHEEESDLNDELK